MSAYMDEIVDVIASALMLAHVAALVWSGWLRKGIAPVIVLNLLVSTGVVIYWAPHISELLHYVDAVWAFVAFELAVFITSILVVFRVHVPRAVIWIEFSVHVLLIAATLTFMFTFKLTRLM